MSNDQASGSRDGQYPFTLLEYKRYGRQLILPGFGIEGQLKLSNASVLVVGAGGLGCPAIQYLAAAGVGRISIVDHDQVDISNLARQILHTDEKLGLNKAVSAAKAARIVNPHIDVQAIQEAFSIKNAISLIKDHDVVLDCTDNVMTRYLISDAAVMCGVQVVSGAGQGYEGQLIVLNKDLTIGAAASGYSKRFTREKEREKRGPCYRCLFPKAPRPEDVTDCEDGGVMGGVTGLVGTMQAVQAIKLLADMGDIDEPLHMTLISPFSYPPFRSVRLRHRRAATCRACGDPQLMSEENMKSKIATDLSNEDYMTFCGLQANTQTQIVKLPEINVQQLSRLGLDDARVIDVRSITEFDIVRLPSSISEYVKFVIGIFQTEVAASDLPLREIQRNPSKALKDISNLIKSANEVYLICRRGNDSKIAQQIIYSTLSEESSIHYTNVKGGLQAWSHFIDDNFPAY